MAHVASNFFENAENFKPLKEGRAGNVVVQGALEPAKARAENEEAKRRFQRDVQSEDPLQAYMSLIRRLKDIYPTGSKQLDDALYEAVQHFSERPEYKNDPRLLSIFVQLADKQKDPRDTFDFMDDKGIAQELPRFHLAKAAAFERAKDYKTAEESYSQAVAVAKLRPNFKEDFDLAMVHLTHFKRRMARLLQDSRAMHGPSSPEAARALKAASRTLASRPALGQKQQPSGLSSQQRPRMGQPPSSSLTGTKRPQFAVFDERKQSAPGLSRPADARWQNLETEATAVENHGQPQPWSMVGTVPQRTGSTVKPPSFAVWREEAPQSEQRQASSAGKASFEVWSDHKPSSASKKRDHRTMEEISVHMDRLRLDAQSTPVSNDRAEQTINTKRAMDDLLPMFGSPSMSAMASQVRTARVMFTPAVWNPNRLGSNDEEEEEDGQNISPSLMNQQQSFPPPPTTTARRPPSSRPVLATLEQHDEGMSPSFRNQMRFPPRPEEKFTIARDQPRRSDTTEDEGTFGISNVLAFGQQQDARAPPPSAARGFFIHRDG